MLHGDEFLNSVMFQNQWVVERKVRRYQLDIVECGTFMINCPFSGKRLSPQGSIYLDSEGFVGYRFEDSKPFWLMASELRFGFPLTTALTADGGMAPVFRNGSIMSPDPRMNPRVYVRLEEAWNIRSLNNRDLIDTAGAVVVLGNPNFAHYIWNELPGALELFSIARPQKDVSTYIVNIYEPLGKLEHLTAIPHWIVRSWNSSEVVEVNQLPGLAVRVGSMVVSQPTKDIIVHLVDQLPQVAHPWGGVGPKFWLSCRLSGRSCINQTEFLRALIQQLLRHYPCCTIYLDGFSYPQDFDSNRRYDDFRAGYIDRCEGVKNFLINLIAGLSCDFSEAVDRIQDISGLSLLKALRVAGEIDFYICHAGTLQHKLGWIFRAPGLIHSCLAGITPSARKWFHSQVENGLAPEVIPERFVEDVLPEPETSLASRNRDYVISPVSEATTFILRVVQEALNS